MKVIALLFSVFSITTFHRSLPDIQYPFINSDSTIHLPLGGNTFARNSTGKSRVITNEGIENWTNHEVTFDTYFRTSLPGSVKIKLKAKSDGQSQLEFEINGVKKEVTVKGSDIQWYETGEWQLQDTGYIKITLSGISKTEERFADISEYEISGTAINNKVAFVKNNEGNFFYWGLNTLLIKKVLKDRREIKTPG